MGIYNYRNIIREEQDKNVQLKSELEKMRRQYVLSEERNQLVVATMTAMRRTNEDESISQKLMISEMKNEIMMLQEKNQVILNILNFDVMKNTNLYLFDFREVKIIFYKRNRNSEI